MGQRLVELENVSVRIDQTSILVGVSLDLEPGEVLGVSGPNGAGKTTLLEVIATVLPPSDGVGMVLGATLGTRDVVGVRPSIGWSGHDPGLYPELTLAENLALAAAIAGISADRVPEVLRQVGLTAAAHRRADRSSNGMRRRVDLARLLLTRPMLLLLDEAHAGLDRDAHAIIDHLIDATTSRGGGAVLVSHNPEALSGRADRMVHIEAGTLVGGEHR